MTGVGTEGTFQGTRNDDYASTTITLDGGPSWLWTGRRVGDATTVEGSLDLRPTGAERVAYRMVCQGAVAPYLGN